MYFEYLNYNVEFYCCIPTDRTICVWFVLYFLNICYTYLENKERDQDISLGERLILSPLPWFNDIFLLYFDTTCITSPVALSMLQNKNLFDAKHANTKIILNNYTFSLEEPILGHSTFKGHLIHPGLLLVSWLLEIKREQYVWYSLFHYAMRFVILLFSYFYWF